MRINFFPTCLGDLFHADAAADAVRLLRSLGVDVRAPAGATCCGQPAFNAGHHGPARDVGLHTVRALDSGESAGADGAAVSADPVVLPSGSCTAMLRGHLVGLLEEGGDGSSRADPEEIAAARRLGERTYELAQFLVDVLDVRELGRGLTGLRVAYHHGCHALRELGIRDAPLTLLEGAGATVVPWEAAEECCGFGGMFSVKNETVSVAMADRKLDTLPEVDVLTSADGGCLLQLEGRVRRRGLRVPVQHLASLLWRGRSAGEALRGRA